MDRAKGSVEKGKTFKKGVDLKTAPAFQKGDRQTHREKRGLVFLVRLIFPFGHFSIRTREHGGRCERNGSAVPIDLPRPVRKVEDRVGVFMFLNPRLKDY